MNESSYVPLRVCSHHSLGWGSASPERLVERAAELRLGTLALTDVDTLAGQMRFHFFCREAGVRPITGVQLGELVVLARNRTGYRSLCRLVQRRRVDALHDGVFILATQPAGITRLLELGYEPEALRLLLPPGRDAAAVQNCSKRTGVSLVADSGVLLADPDHSELHALLRTIRGLPPVPQPRSLQSPEQMAHVFRHAPEALTETLRVAEQCELDLCSNPPLLPHVPDAQRRLELRCGPPDERLSEELQVIHSRDLAGYFLLVAEIADEARRRAIPCTARGSAVAAWSRTGSA